MMLNMDRSQRIVVDTNVMDWQPSPAVGVNRKPLERQAAESGQVSSVVEYLPESQFAAHFHPMGEEIMVLDGVFEDNHGRYPAGTYLRNPPGSEHAPGSREGCRLLVKLNMFHPQDRAQVQIDTKQREWLPGLVDGLSVMPLHQFSQEEFSEQVALVRWQPGTQFNPHSHFGGEEIFVLEGRFEDEFGAYPTGTWIRNPDNSRHQPFSEQGCVILVKTGHLRRLQELSQDHLQKD